MRVGHGRAVNSICWVPGPSGSVAYITAWQADAARQKQPGGSARFSSSL